MRVSRAAKLKAWMRVFARQPREAVDRVLTVLDVQADRWLVQPPAYEDTPAARAFRTLEERFATPIAPLLVEADQVQQAVEERLRRTAAETPIKADHNGDFVLARLCYVACRLARPAQVVETGVASGVTSAFLLAALHANGEGALHSIDLPPLGPEVDRFVGVLIPDHLRYRWTLHRGITRRVLPGLLADLGCVDVFVHDSLHTYRNIRRELELVTPFLSPGGIVLADDIDENPAFQEWAHHTPLRQWMTVREADKDRLLGLALLNGAQS